MTRAEYEEMVKQIAKEETDNAFQKAYEFGAGYTSTGNEKMITYIRTLERTVELLSRQVQFDDEIKCVDPKAKMRLIEEMGGIRSTYGRDD